MLFKPAVHTCTFNLHSTMTLVSTYRWKNQRSGNRINIKVTQLVSGATRMCTYVCLVLLTTVLTLCPFLLKHMVIHSTHIVQTSNIRRAPYWKYRERRDERPVWDIKGHSGTWDPELLFPSVVTHGLSLLTARGIQRGRSHDCSRPGLEKGMFLSFHVLRLYKFQTFPSAPPPRPCCAEVTGSLRRGLCGAPSLAYLPRQGAQQFAPLSACTCYVLVRCGYFINR